MTIKAQERFELTHIRAPRRWLKLQPGGVSPEELYDNMELDAAVRQALATLKPQEEEALRLRFGLDPFTAAHTLKEIGDYYGKSQERARQILAKGLRKLRHYSRAKKLLPFVTVPWPEERAKPKMALFQPLAEEEAMRRWPGLCITHGRHQPCVICEF